jgi:hypothetical protein
MPHKEPRRAARKYLELMEQGRKEEAFELGLMESISASEIDSVREARAVDSLMADFTGRVVETPAREQTDLSEQEDRGSEAQDRPGGYFGMEEFIKVGAEDDGTLPQSVREDTELKEELLRRNHEEHFGAPDPRSDDEMWSAYLKSIGEDA